MTPVTEVLDTAAVPITLTPDDRARMADGADRLRKYLADGHPVYGVTRGFGPLVEHDADDDPAEQGRSLIHHLCTGQGRPLGVAETRLLVWLRLAGMRAGYSGVDPADWERLAAVHNRGFVPVVPSEGSLSASGDLVPLAHAALAMAGTGQAYAATPGAPRRDAAERLVELGLEAVTWTARTALAFVNGTSAALAVTLLNHARLAVHARALAAVTGHLARLLGARSEAWHPALQQARNQPGQARAAAWIRAELDPAGEHGVGRPLQESYSLRCTPQIIGAVLDQLDLQSTVLAAEAAGVSDNPIVTADGVLHGGNFHAAPVGLAAEALTPCVHQLAYLAERQIAVICDPARNGGRPPLLAARPGADSGLAGLQIAATSHLGRIRQLGYPASMTPVPTNLHNQDHVPMALNAALAGRESLRYLTLIIGSLAVAVTQLDHAGPDDTARAGVWRALARVSRPLERDRPLATEIRAAAATVTAAFGARPGLFTFEEEEHG